MKNFGFILLLSCVSLFVSCGSREDSSSLEATRRPRPERSYPNNHTNHDPALNNGSADGRFPTHPHLEVTPGALCDRASEYRYPEHIKYCNRDVEGQTKAALFVMYDTKFGYHTTQMNRSSFKIDHLIPLCLGGSNDEENLWPQHVSIYEHTDPVEPYLCDVLSAGKIKQAEAVQIILAIKQDPFHAEDELRKLESRF
jgi:hypothetical protein